MREYDEKNQITAMKCNLCKRKLRVEEGIVKEGCFSVNYSWGYFSNKDGTQHEFDLCEECYDAFIDGLAIPITGSEKNELL